MRVKTCYFIPQETEMGAEFNEEFISVLTTPKERQKAWTGISSFLFQNPETEL